MQLKVILSAILPQDQLCFVRQVLDTVIEVFNSGGSSKLDIPEPSYLCPVADPVNSSMTKQERFQAYRQRMLLRRQKAEMYSLWCDALYKLSLANHVRLLIIILQTFKS